MAEFLDVVVHDEEFDFRIQQVRVSPESSLVGQKLDDLDIPGATGVQVLALRKSGTTSFTFNPHGENAVSPNCVLIGFGTLEGIEALQLLARG